MTLTAQQITEMAARVHTANGKWWIDLDTQQPIKRNMGELLMLCISELSEALEGDRKNLMDDKLPHRKMLEVELADALIRTLDIIGGLHVSPIQTPPYVSGWPDNTAECLLVITCSYVNAMLAITAHQDRDGFAYFEHHMSRAVERLVSLSDHLGLDIMGAYEEKMAYNATRHDHSIEGRKAEGGKKY